MKTYITGTSRGLGEALVSRFQREMVFGEVIELNRPDFDITNESSRQFMASLPFDIFINNAHDGFGQVELLYSLFEANKERDCVIINIGSVAADGDRKEVKPYAIEKKALDAACTQLQLVDSKCKVIQVKLGRMKTDMVKHIDAPKMDVMDVARDIVEVYEMSQGNKLIKTITIDVKGDQYAHMGDMKFTTAGEMLK